jgi:hypothetical protein
MSAADAPKISQVRQDLGMAKTSTPRGAQRQQVVHHFTLNPIIWQLRCLAIALALVLAEIKVEPEADQTGALLEVRRLLTLKRAHFGQPRSA